MEDKPEEAYICPDFCGEFLRGCLPERQNAVVHALHGLMQKRYDDTQSVCESLLKEVENAEGVGPFVYGMILKKISLELLRASESEIAIKLLHERLNNLKHDDFTTLLILGTVYEKKGEYDHAFKAYERAYDSASQNDDNLQSAVSLAKMATSRWHLEQPEFSRIFTDKSKQTFDKVSSRENVNAEELNLLVHYYKTTAYLNRVNGKHAEARYFYSQALDTINKHQCSKLEELKVLSQLSLCCAQLTDVSAVDQQNQRSLSIIEELFEKNSEYISAHASQLIHIMSRIGFVYTRVRNFDAALEAREKTLKLARNFLGNANPEVARTAADIAILCHEMNKPRRIPEFVDIFQKSLDDCNYKNDESKMKQYVRELTDALSNFAYFNSLQSNYAAAEENYKEAIDINMKVYGEVSLRTAKVTRFLGRTYRKWGKHDLAKECLRKSFLVVVKCQPNNTKLQNELRKELEKSGTRRKKSYKNLF